MLDYKYKTVSDSVSKEVSDVMRTLDTSLGWSCCKTTVASVRSFVFSYLEIWEDSLRALRMELYTIGDSRITMKLIYD